MSKAVCFEQIGAPDVLKIIDVPMPSIGKSDDVLIRHTAIGVNDIDLRHRSGFFKFREGRLNICGYEACGIAEAIGDNVSKIMVGDRVAYATAPMGSYCEHRVVDQKYLFKIPDDMDDRVLLANLFKGLTGHYLTKRAFVTNNKMAVLVHDASNATAQAVFKFAVDSGATVLVTARDQSCATFLSEMGCREVMLLSEDWAGKILSLSNNTGISAVYDNVGKDVIRGSLKCLMYMGIYLNYDESSGRLPLIHSNLLSAKSLFFTKCSLFHYKKHYMELVLSVQDVIARIAEGMLDIPFIEMGLSEAVVAHQNLENFQNTHSIILKPFA